MRNLVPARYRSVSVADVDVDLNEIDLVAEIRQYFGCHERPAVTALPGLREIAGARQQHRDLQGLRLRLEDRRGRKRCSCGRSADEQAPAAQTAARDDLH